MSILGKVIKSVAAGAAEAAGAVIAKKVIDKKKEKSKLRTSSGAAIDVPREEPRSTISSVDYREGRIQFLKSIDSAYDTINDYFLQIGTFRWMIICKYKELLLRLQNTSNFPDLNQLEINYQIPTFSFEDLGNFLMNINENINLDDIENETMIYNKSGSYRIKSVENVVAKLGILGFEDNTYFISNGIYVPTKKNMNIRKMNYKTEADYNKMNNEYNYCIDYFGKLIDNQKNLITLMKKVMSTYLNYSRDLADILSEKSDYNQLSKVESKIVYKVYVITRLLYKLISFHIVDYKYEEEFICEEEINNVLELVNSIMRELSF